MFGSPYMPPPDTGETPKVIVYLAGPIDDDWRDDITTRLTRLGHIAKSPMVRDYRGNEEDSADEIVSSDKADIDASEVIIAYCPKPLVDTSMEVLYAWERGRRVVVYVPFGAKVSPWLRYHSHVILTDPGDVVRAAAGGRR